MARTVNGVSTILKASRIICRMVGRFGTAGMAQQTTPAFAAAVTALASACMAFEALDDYPGEIDRTPPYGHGDIEGG